MQHGSPCTHKVPIIQPGAFSLYLYAQSSTFRTKGETMILPRSSYYDREYKQGASLIRARRPYLIRNAWTGLALCGFVFGVYTFTIRAISQDEFEDVQPPPLANKLEDSRTSNDKSAI